MNGNQQQTPIAPQKQPPYFGGNAQQGNAALSEQGMMQDMLSCAKALADGYSLQTQESACPQLRQLLMENWGQTMTDQYAIFDAMRTRNWYPVKEAPQPDVEQAKQTFMQMKTQLQ